jgi:hypothetical protein
LTSGTLDNARLPAAATTITSVGTLTGLTVTNAINGTLTKTVTGANSTEIVRVNMADNDQFRILVGGTGSNAGYVEIATADDGTEPIYVRQYTGVFSSLTRTATLLDGSGNTTFPGIVTASTFTGSPTAATTTTAASGVGYMGLPQNATTTGAYTIVAADAGKHIYSTATRTVTIPANASVAMPVGSTVVFVAASGATVTIAITTDTMYLAGPGTTGSRTLAAFGMATAVKITSTSWIISGNGLT